MFSASLLQVVHTLPPLLGQHYLFSEEEVSDLIHRGRCRFHFDDCGHFVFPARTQHTRSTARRTRSARTHTHNSRRILERVTSSDLER